MARSAPPTAAPRLRDAFDLRLAHWLLYRLRGGTPELLERVLRADRYEVAERYDLLVAVLTGDTGWLAGRLAPADRDLLAGAPSGPADGARLAELCALANRAKAELIARPVAVVRCPANGPDLKLPRVVVTREQFNRLVGDLFARISADLPPPLDEESRSYLDQVYRIPEGWESPGVPAVRVAEPKLGFHGVVPAFGELADGALRGRRTGLPAALQPPAGLSFERALDLLLEHLAIPRQLGVYEIEELLGHGPVTLTFLARDLTSRLHRKVVLKVFTAALERGRLSDDVWRLSFTESHDNVLPYEDLKQIGALEFLTMPFLGGGDLQGALDPLAGSARGALLVRALLDACRGLFFVHQRGVVHGAVTPANILFSPETRRFKLADLLPVRLRDGGPAGEPRDDVRALVEACAAHAGAGNPWLDTLVERCARREIADAGELLRALISLLEPEGSPLAILAAVYNPEREIVHFNLEVDGAKSEATLDVVGVGSPVLEALWQRWDELGELAMARAQQPTPALNRRIRGLLDSAAREATGLVLGPEVLGRLAAAAPEVLWVRHEPELAAVPWELLEIAGERAGRRFAMARWPRLTASARRARLTSGRSLRFLLIADPTGELDGARQECERLADELHDRLLDDRITVVPAPDNPLDLRTEIQRSDLVHFAGHGLFSRVHPLDSGLLLGRRLGRDDVLRARKLANLFRDRAPFLVFANACRSAWMDPQVAHPRVTSDAEVGLGQAFLAAGVANYVGTLWEAPDSWSTVDFASEFYRWLFSGATVSRAALEARRACASRFGEKDLTWARYVLFGHPFDRIELAVRS